MIEKPILGERYNILYIYHKHNTKLTVKSFTWDFASLSFGVQIKT